MQIVLRENETMEDLIARLVTSFAMVNGIAPVAYWYENLNENGRIKDIHFSQQMRELLGYRSVAEFPDELDTFVKAVHPDDLPDVLENVIAAGTGKTDKYDARYRIRKADGSYMWCNATGKLVKDSRGRTVGMYGAFIDISAQIEVQSAQQSLAENIAEKQEIAGEKARLEEALAFTNFFLSTYVSAYYVNLDTFEWQVYKRTEELERDYPITNGYLDSLLEYIESSVHPDDREGLRAIVQPQRMRELLRRQPEYNHHFREVSADGEKILKMQVIRGADEQHAAFGFVDVTGAIKEQQKQLLGATPLSPEILSKANIGLWAFELDEGKPPRMYVDETMLGLIGLAEQVPPETTYHAWYDRVDRDSYNLVNDAVGKMMAGEHAEVQYPWHHPDGRTLIVRCGGVRNFEYRAGVRIEGTHQNVTEVLHFDEEMRRQKIREIIEPFTADYNLVYRVSLADASYSLLKMDDNIIGKGMEFADFTAAKRFFIEEVAYGPDREMLREALDFASIREKLASADRYSLEYRAVINGVALWHELVISSLGEGEVVIAFGLKDEEILTGHIGKTLIDNYDGIYVVNLETDQLKILKGVGFTKDKPSVMSNSGMLLELAARLRGEDKEYFTKLTDVNYFRQQLAKDGKIEYYYQSPNLEEKPVWLKCEIHVLTMVDGVAETVVVGITRADSVQRERIELGVQLQAALAAVTEEKERFTVVRDLINSAHWSFKLDENDEITDAEFFGDVGQVLNYDLVITPHAWETILHPEDKEKTLKAFYAAIADHSGRTPYDVNYRMLDREGKYNWFRSAGKIIELKDGSREFFGIHVNINSRIEQEQEQQKLHHFRAFGDMVNAGLWSIDVNDKDEVVAVEWSDEFRHMFGYRDKKDFPDKLEAWSELLHPGDKERVLEHFWDGVRNKKAEELVYDESYRILKKNGEYCWYKTVGRMDYNADGTRKLYGMTKDISADKRLVEQQRQLHKALSKSQADNKLIREQSVITSYFLASYTSAYYVGLDDMSCRIYRRSPKLEERYPIKTSFLATLDEYIDDNVPEAEREELKELLRPGRVRELLSGQNEYTHTFRIVADGQERTFMLIVIRGEDDNHAGFGFRDITDEINEQNRRRKEAEESRNLIKSVASVYKVALAVNMTDGSCRLLRMDSDVRYRYQIEKFTRFSEARAHLAEIIHASDLKRVMKELDFAVIREKIKNNAVYNVEYRVISDKATKWHEMNINRISDDEIAIGFAERDLEITKRHLEEKRFAEYFALYEVDIDNETVKVVIDSPFYGVAEVGTALPYAGTMRAFASGLDGEASEFFTKMADLGFVRQALASDDKHTYTYRSNNLEDRKWVDCTSIVTYRHDDGSPAMFSLGFSYIDSHGAARQELQSRIAQQKVQLEVQQEQLRRALSLAQSASRAKTNFLFNMSHDIRTPMNAITGFTTMAKKYLADKEKVADYLNKIDTSGKQLLTLVNQVLEMARIESGVIELEEKPVNVRERFDTMMTVLTEQAEVKGLKFHCALKDAKHINILADDARATQIALNVGGNAMKYTPEGGRVEFILQEKPCSKEGFARFTFTITDTGIGMSKEFQKVMFEPFTREKSSTVSQIQGTGLGMSIVKKLVDLMGGTIEVQSELGKGTRFDITIDFKIDKAAKATAEVADRPEKPATFAGKRVLLVEDNELNREIAKDILEEFGLLVEEADDGDVALAMIQQAAERGDYDYYKLVLMDIQMPRMNGYDATRAIRALPVPAGLHLPIVAMTANAFEEDRRNAFAAGMDAHLAKPIEIDKLLETLARFL